jgi:hypothetical protein
MTATTVQAVVAAAQQLSPSEQLEVIQALTRVLQQRFPQTTVQPSMRSERTIDLPATVRRTAPVSDLRDFAADFWPEDETADDINEYLAQQRATDRMRDLPDLDHDV